MATISTPVVQQVSSPDIFSGGWRNNPNYMVNIVNNKSDADPIYRRVTAYLPEQFHLRLQNSWEPFMGLIDNTTIGSLANTANDFLKITGHSINPKFLTALIWKHTSPLEFNMTLMFDAKSDAFTDVTQNIAALITMSTPVRNPNTLAGQLFLDAPGPTLATPDNRISMSIGRLFYIDSVVINSMDITFYTAAQYSGDFIAADVELSLSGWYTPDRDDIFSYFGINNTATNQFIKNPPADYSGSPMIYTPPGLGILQSLLGPAPAAPVNPTNPQAPTRF